MLAKLIKWTAVLVFLLAVGAYSALADGASITSSLDQCHITGGCETASPFGTVTLTQDGPNVLGIVSLLGGAQFVKTGAGDRQAFLLAAPTLTSGQFDITSPTSPVLTVSEGPFNLHGEGEGTFHIGFGCTTCTPGASEEFPGPIRFTVSGATLSEFTANDEGQFFAADLILSNGKTGEVSSDSIEHTRVPEPSTLVLVLSGLTAGLIYGLFRDR